MNSNFSSPSFRRPWMNDLVQQIQAEVLARLDWMGISRLQKKSQGSEQKESKVRMLDYACGWGELSRTLFPFVDEARGIDLSAAMVKAYNENASTAKIAPEQMHALQGDLLSSKAADDGNPFGGEEWFDFDVAVMSMALHHVASPDDAVKTLVERVKERGLVLIVDWELDSVKFNEGADRGHQSAHHRHHHGGHHAHAHNVVPGSEHTITRAGFGKEEMKKMFWDAGCDDVDFVEFAEMTRLGDGQQAVMQRLFLAKGRKGGVARYHG
ncbi:MAG: hypothetical protein Q9222_005537 [Ikaeria aurantiellina]